MDSDIPQNKVTRPLYYPDEPERAPHLRVVRRVCLFTYTYRGPVAITETSWREELFRWMGRECNCLESCLKAHLKNSRKTSHCHSTKASACARIHTHTHNTHSFILGSPLLRGPRLVNESSRKEGLSTHLSLWHTKCTGPLCLVSLNSVNQFSCSLDPMQKHACVRQLQEQVLPQAHPTLICLH